jgi:hypothetical protein
MNEKELIQAAAPIAGALAAHSYTAGDRGMDRYREIAKAAVAIALEIEKEAKDKVKIR